MKELLLATHNNHKLIELKSLLKEYDINIISLSDLNEQDEVEETGSTFFENAYLKASYFAKKHQLPTLADDSGLVVEALSGQPGIYSARYSGRGDHENNLKVLKEMEGKENRVAYFVSSLVLCYPNGEHKAYEASVYGKIMHEIKGENGFGYDAIFYYPPFQKGFAEIPLEQKNKISHRAKAYHMLKEDLF